MTYKYTPKGVCSREMEVELDENGIIKNVTVIGGCNGNSKGVIALIKNRKAEEVIELLSGVNCGGRGTSCPDQLAECLKEALELI